TALLVLAMANYRLGQRDEGRKWFTKADDWYDATTRELLAQTSLKLNWGWHSWLQFQVLWREAKTLIEGSAPKEDANLEALQRRAPQVLKGVGKEKPRVVVELGVATHVS